MDICFQAAAAARIAANDPTDIFDAAYKGDLWLVADLVTVDPTCARARHRLSSPDAIELQRAGVAYSVRFAAFV
jgi:hypothetical protein